MFISLKMRNSNVENINKKDDEKETNAQTASSIHSDLPVTNKKQVVINDIQAPRKNAAILELKNIGYNNQG